MATELSASREIALPLDETYDAVLPLPLPDLFNRRFGAIPPIREVRDQEGAWGTVGQTRTIVLADGGTMVEQLTVVTRPDRFGYDMGTFTGPLKPLVASAEGLWSFESYGAGTRVTWSWTVHPRGLAGRLAMPVFGWMWRGYARKALARLDQLIGG